MRRIPLLLAVACLAACGDGAPAAAPYTPGASHFAATTDDCGTFDLDQGEDVPEDAATCLLDAFTAQRVVTMKATFPTTEGDPIPVTYTTRADGRIDVTTDSRADGLGTPIIERETCSALTWDERDGLRTDGCDEPVRVEE
ncbi:hypothetical protein FB565_009028 [Actinoplanes lutulentus]|uniref:Subtilisin inhibitor-like n=1 Tax=Actinoplanes lutulentus TaxID=1287878 RepID=A0A327Z9L7_9ACTN|nr:DUF4362 domain-containing protein [Actinoplanes lutulentus]MBB2949223.1 hypothetical protein [Actinoplanes lutulentus]RAK34626.1 hypothetical protein B0I29_111228 [Actinoplanes lutulentus]